MENKGFNKLNVSLPMSMDTAAPLDYNSFFKNISDAQAAAATAIEAGGDSSKYYIGQLITVADTDNNIVKYYKIDTDKSLKEIAAEYTVGQGLSSGIDSLGNTVIRIKNDIYNHIEDGYTTTKTGSAKWNKAFSTVNSLSSGWEDARTHVIATSSDANSVYGTVESLSGLWNEAYSTQGQWFDSWTTTYYTMVSTSAKWHQNYLSTRENSARWNRASTVVESTSANNESVYSTVLGTSSVWSAAYAKSNQIYGVIPSETWENANSLADKAYVEEKVRSQIIFFRGSFATWDDVPTTSAGYNMDLSGNYAPKNGDYMVVLDDSSKTTTAVVSANPIGEKLAQDAVDFYGTVVVAKDTVLESSHITLLKNNDIDTVTVYKTGSWRYRFVGEWVEGTVGKNRWVSEYRVNTTAFTEDQLAAINSGIDSAKVQKILKNESSLNNISATSGNWNNSYTVISTTSANNDRTYNIVKSCSAEWNTVVEKIAEDYFNYYTASAWSILTDDDTDYSLVPSGMVLIYEDDGSSPTPSRRDNAMYTKSDGVLTFGKSTTYDGDYGIIYLGNGATYDATTNTLTIPGSSDIAADCMYNYDSGEFKFSQTAKWDANTGILSLGEGSSFNSASGTVTLRGTGIHDADRSTFNITNRLAYVKNDNSATTVNRGQQYKANLSPINSNYRMTSMKCVMCRTEIPVYYGNSFFIPSVSGDITITATAEPSVTKYYSITNNLTHATNSNPDGFVEEMERYQAKITADAGYTITSITCTMGGISQTVIGHDIDINGVNGNIVITAVAELIA